MNTSLSIPTDNIYKFICIFGLALVIAGILSFATTYSTSLDKKIKYSEEKIILESKENRSKADSDLLSLNTKLLNLTIENERFVEKAISAFFGVGFMTSIAGAIFWYYRIQKRDDRISSLQEKKLMLEIEALCREIKVDTENKEIDIFECRNI